MISSIESGYQVQPLPQPQARPGGAPGTGDPTHREISRTHDHADSSAAEPLGQRAEQGDLSAEDTKKVEDLKKRDDEVRRHEQAHKAAAGQYARGGAQFEYETGPDGKRYAVGGEVNIDTSTISNDPEGSIRKAEQIKRAALAPESPSGQDRKVAADADKMKAEAQKEMISTMGGELNAVKALYDPSGRKREGTKDPGLRFDTPA